ncbi:MAG: DNA polymerase III subunit delta [Gammaproteobacteria bacterium]|nr:DNA polymerase III subunit delta [Gammaproteobacteria bacterium]
MRLRPEQLAAQLKGPLPPVLLLSGDEPLQMLEAADLIRAQARAQGYSERILLETQAHFDWNQLAAESANRSLFGDRRLFDLRLHSAAIGNEGSKALSAWCERPADDSLLLISAPKLDKKQLSTKWIKAVDQLGVLVQIWPVDAGQLPAWLEQRMRSRGLQPERGVAALLAERVEGNLLAATQEIEKLLLLQGPGPISQDALLQAVSDSARYDVFGLVDEALAGRAARCVRILAGLQAEGEPAPVVLWALSRELRSLYPMARQLAGGGNLAAVVDGYRVWPKRKPLVSAALKRLNPRRLQQALIQCGEADAAIKGRRKQDPWLLLEQLCLSLCGLELSPNRVPG